jgi:hypothetical protein
MFWLRREYVQKLPVLVSTYLELANYIFMGTQQCSLTCLCIAVYPPKPTAESLSKCWIKVDLPASLSTLVECANTDILGQHAKDWINLS